MASSWTCARCSAQNDEGAVSCRSCGMIRGGVVTQPNVLTPPTPTGNAPVPGGYQGAPAPGGFQGAPAPGGYPGAPVPAPSMSPKRSLAAGILGNIGARLVVLVIIVAAGGVIAFFTNAGRNSSGQIDKAGDMAPADLLVGDCYDLPGDTLSPDPSATIEKTRAIPCAQAHHYEVFYRGDYSGSQTYPTEAELGAWTDTFCTPAFEAYVGTTADKTTLTYYYFFPSEASWRSGSRGVQCSLADPNLAPLTGTLKGSGR